MRPMFEWLRRQRSVFEDSLTKRGLAHTLSLSRFSLHRLTTRALRQHARGSCLDAGSGRGPYHQLLLARCRSVTTMDVEDRARKVDVKGDIQAMQAFTDGEFDLVLCTQVLEHVPRPWDAMSEFRRVLRPGGKLILTVPHLSAMHEVPHDYYRFTRFGLQTLCDRAGLRILELHEVGGLVAFLSHGLSYSLTSATASVPGLRWIAWGLNLLLIQVARPADRFLGLRSVYPCNILVLAEAP